MLCDSFVYLYVSLLFSLLILMNVRRRSSNTTHKSSESSKNIMILWLFLFFLGTMLIILRLSTMFYLFYSEACKMRHPTALYTQDAPKKNDQNNLSLRGLRQNAFTRFFFGGALFYRWIQIQFNTHAWTFALLVFFLSFVSDFLWNTFHCTSELSVIFLAATRPSGAIHKSVLNHFPSPGFGLNIKYIDDEDRELKKWRRDSRNRQKSTLHFQRFKRVWLLVCTTTRLGCVFFLSRFSLKSYARSLGA